MANITAAEVNKLRQQTGAGMMDCKKALVEAEGDFDKAIEVLRKKGQKVAANRSDRESSEGAAVALVNADKTRGVVLTLNCETDFVGKNEGFQALAKELAEKAINFNSKEEFLASPFDATMTVAEKCVEQTGVIGEKIEIGSFEVFLLINSINSNTIGVKYLSKYRVSITLALSTSLTSGLLTA